MSLRERTRPSLGMPTAFIGSRMNALFRRELTVLAALIVFSQLPQIATAHDVHCLPGQRAVSEGNDLHHCEAVV